MEQGTRTTMMMPKRRRLGEHDDGRRAAAKKHRRGQGQGLKHLYLIFDDWTWGYSIREINLQPASARKRKRNSPSSGRKEGTTIPVPGRLPRPFIRMEAWRGYPNFFAAVGTKILATHFRNTLDEDSVASAFIPIIDVRSRGVNFGPAGGDVCQDTPIFLPIGDDELFTMDSGDFRALSLKPIWGPRQQACNKGQSIWSWHNLSPPPFQRVDVTSYAVHSDKHIILVSTRSVIREEEEATFALHTDKFRMVEGEQLVWTRLGEWSLPLAGRAHFVHCLDAFVGLSKDPATLGHLCSSFCDPEEADGPPPAWKLGKEKLFSDDPAETHVGATLVHMGGSEWRSGAWLQEELSLPFNDILSLLRRQWRSDNWRHL